MIKVNSLSLDDFRYSPFLKKKNPKFLDLDKEDLDLFLQDFCNSPFDPFLLDLLSKNKKIQNWGLCPADGTLVPQEFTKDYSYNLVQVLPKSEKKLFLDLSQVTSGIYRGLIAIHDHCNVQVNIFNSSFENQVQMRIGILMIGSDSNLETEIHSETHNHANRDLWVDHWHLKSKTKASMNARIFGFENSKQNLNTSLRVFPKVEKVESLQKCECKILDSHAFVSQFPKLFVSNNDVKCVHGTSFSVLGDEEKFFLKSRGVSEESAKKIIIDGFRSRFLNFLSDEQRKVFLQRNYSLKNWSQDEFMERE